MSVLTRVTEGLRGLIKLTLNVLLVLSIAVTRFLDVLTRFLDVLTKVLVHYNVANTPPTLFALLFSAVAILFF